MTNTAADTEITKKIEDLYFDASGSWIDADWNHERVIANYGHVLDEYGSPVYCDGQADSEHGSCQICTQATSDAAAAEKLAEEAIDAFRAGNYSEAAELAEQAADLELTWGDHPTWGEFAHELLWLDPDKQNE